MKRTLVVWGEGNMDEMTVTGATHVADAHDGKVETYLVRPEDVGLRRAEFAEIRGAANPQESASQVRNVLGGTPGARLDMVLLNAGAALMAAGRAATLRQGVDQARAVTQSGPALAKLAQLDAFCKKQQD